MASPRIMIFVSGTHELSHVRQDGCLTIRLCDSDIFRKMEPTVRLIAALIDEQKPRATLIDFRDVPVPASFLERYELGEMAGKYLPGRPIAALIRPDQADRGHIGKVVAVNRGALVEVFTEAALAETWLKKHADTQEPA